MPGGERGLIGLARVSTDAQDAQLQQDALVFAGCTRIYSEKASTRKAAADRPGLAAALGYLRPGDSRFPSQNPSRNLPESLDIVRLF